MSFSNIDERQGGICVYNSWMPNMDLCYSYLSFGNNCKETCHSYLCVILVLTYIVHNLLNDQNGILNSTWEILDRR